MYIIDGKAYIFNSSRQMYSDTYVKSNGNYYYVNKDGVVVRKSGWYKLSDGTDIYVDNNGYAVIGIVKWNGKDYISG